MKISVNLFFLIFFVLFIWLFYLSVVIVEQSWEIHDLHLKIKKLNNALEYSQYGNEDRVYLSVSDHLTAGDIIIKSAYVQWEVSDGKSY